MKRPRIKVKKMEVSSSQIHKTVLEMDKKNHLGALEIRRRKAEEEIREEMSNLNKRKIEFSGGKIYIYSDINDVFMGQSVLC